MEFKSVHFRIQNPIRSEVRTSDLTNYVVNPDVFTSAKMHIRTRKQEKRSFFRNQKVSKLPFFKTK